MRGRCFTRLAWKQLIAEPPGGAARHSLMTASMKVQSEMLGKAGQQQQRSAANEGPVTFQAWQNVMLDALNGAGKH